MDNYTTIVRVLTLTVTLASIFAIFVVTILKVIRRAAFFSGRSIVLVAVSLSILFLVALSQYLVGPGDAYHTGASGIEVNSATRYFLLPGIALGVAAAVLLSQVLLLASKKSTENEPKLLTKKSDRPVAKSQSPGRPKKQKPAEEESKKVTRSTGTPSRAEYEKAPAK